MKKSLENLGKDICNFNNNIKSSQNSIVEEFKKKVIVALAVGGKGQRLESITSGKLNKNVIVVNSQGDTMVERIIKMYHDAGIKNFVALVYTKADSIIDILGDGSKYGVEITYSHDPKKQVGRGGAVLNAVLNNSIPRDSYLIVHNPCDQIVDLPNFVDQCISGYLNGESQGCLATAIVTKSTPYTFTGMKISNGFVNEIEMYPQIPVPAHIGVTIFSPKIYKYFEKLFNLEEKHDFEQILFPYLTKQNQLYAFGIEYENWIAVKDPKSLNRLKKMLI